MSKHKSWLVSMGPPHYGWLVESPKLGKVECPNHITCRGYVQYNGNYFCTQWEHPVPEEPSLGHCNWALDEADDTGAILPEERDVWNEINDRWEEIHGERLRD